MITLRVGNREAEDSSLPTETAAANNVTKKMRYSHEQRISK
jgi:hypothetical protein